MSPAADLAARIIDLLAKRRPVPPAEQMRLRYLALQEERTLPLDEIARRILERERNNPPKADAARQG